MMFKKSQRGFTLLELVALLAVLGILAVVAAARVTNTDVEVITSADVLKEHIRYAQTMAMNSNPNAPSDATVWGISCSGTSYWLFNGTNPGVNIVLLPEDDKYLNPDRTINLANKKINISSFTVYFDNRGIPYSAYPGTLWAGTPISVTPAGGSGATVTVNITPFTGYVP